jgi:hypothetical protein
MGLVIPKLDEKRGAGAIALLRPAGKARIATGGKPAACLRFWP